MKYYGITNEHGYTGRFLCERCADCVDGTGYDIIEHDHDPDPATEDVGTWCDSCNAPLDTAHEEDYPRRVASFRFATHYRSVPISRFREATEADVLETLAAVSEGYETAATDWSRDALRVDGEGATLALTAIRAGGRAFIAQDEDGYYFAVVDPATATLEAGR